MKKEMTLWERLKAPKPKPVRLLFVVCVIVALTIQWIKFLHYLADIQPDEAMKEAFIIGNLLAGFSLGLWFSVDEDAHRKKTALDNIKSRIQRRTL